MRRVQTSIVTHDPLAAATSRANGKRTAKDIVMKTEWENAWRETTEAADQVAVHWKTNQPAQLSWAAAGTWGAWQALTLPTIANGTSLDNRTGSKIQVKAFTSYMTFKCFQPADSTTVVIRKVWVVDHQPKFGIPTTPDDVFDSVPAANTNWTGINCMLNASNQLRFKVLSDETLTYPFKSMSSVGWSKTDHFDLDFIMSWPANNVTGLPEEVTSNAIYCFLFPVFATAAPGLNTFAILCQNKISFVDG